jgi:S-adenosyl methyltransferase
MPDGGRLPAGWVYLPAEAICQTAAVVARIPARQRRHRPVVRQVAVASPETRPEALPDQGRPAASPEALAAPWRRAEELLRARGTAIDPATPATGRIYNYLLGGPYHFAADRAAAERIREQMPDVADAAVANRDFHGRAAAWMAQRGIRQFIDLGAGLPVPGSTHEIVRQEAPRARVCYVDIDPVIVVLAGQLTAAAGTTAVVEADLCDTGRVLADPAVRELIDLRQPAGVLLTSVLHFIGGDQDPHAVVARYAAALAPGSYLALSHVTSDNLPEAIVRRGAEVYRRATQRVHPRSHAEVSRFFDGLDIVPPWPGAPADLTHPGWWGAGPDDGPVSDGTRSFYCAVARRPRR